MPADMTENERGCFGGCYEEEVAWLSLRECTRPEVDAVYDEEIRVSTRRKAMEFRKSDVTRRAVGRK